MGEWVSGGMEKLNTTPSLPHSITPLLNFSRVEVEKCSSWGEAPDPKKPLRLSALASLGLVASLWVASTLKGRLRVSAR